MQSHYKKEANKYSVTIPSREHILDVITKKLKTKQQLFDLLKINDPQKKPLTKRLTAMVKEQQISYTNNGFYTKFYAKDFLTGTVIANPRGFGFIKLNSGGEDLRLSVKQMQLVFHGDTVKVRMLSASKDVEIIKVITTAKTLIAQLHIKNHKAYAITDHKYIKHSINIAEITKNLKDGQIVIIKILSPPTLDKLASGKVIKVLGESINTAIKTDSILYQHQIPLKFSKNTINQTCQLTTKISTQDQKNRVDLTKLALITIDDKDAYDFDDAVYAQSNNNGWRLLVAIADVSHYVDEHSSLDEEAAKRGNSVYFLHRVVPMLPEILANEICSLKPKTKRLCLTCEMQIDKNGNLINYKFYCALMLSNARLNYTEVSEILENKNPKLTKKYAAIMKNLTTLYSLYKALKKAKLKRGAMDFNKTESKISFDNNYKINDISTYSTNDAHKLIEECMLMANQASAIFLAKNNENFLYRVHPIPTMEKTKATRKFLASVGLTLKGGIKPQTKDFAKILTNIKGRDDENIIKIIIMRTMQQAIYTPNNEGHFGLALDNYTHFTSPIRRYADLLTHRAIKRVINKNTKRASTKMLQIGTHLSTTERRAEEASRDLIKWLKCQYMQYKINKLFDGVITNITNFAIFIELNNTGIEGLITLNNLNNDYYIYDNIYKQLKGRCTRKIYKLGEKVKVKVLTVNVDACQINFALSQ